MACPEGIEPPTHSLEGCCSIQLSYGQRSREMNGRGERIRTFDPLVPNQMRYQAALRPDLAIVIGQNRFFAPKWLCYLNEQRFFAFGPGSMLISAAQHIFA